MLEVCQQWLVRPMSLKFKGMLTILPWYHGLEAIQEGPIVPVDCRSEEENGHHYVKVSKATILVPSDRGYVESFRMFVDVDIFPLV